MIAIRMTLIGATAAAAAVLTPAAAQAAPLPHGALVSARSALHGWQCGPIADQKFACSNTSGAGFVVVQRSTASLPKWQDDPQAAPEVAVVRKNYFLSVSPNTDLSAAQFAAVKKAVAHSH